MILWERISARDNEHKISEGKHLLRTLEVITFDFGAHETEIQNGSKDQCHVIWPWSVSIECGCYPYPYLGLLLIALASSRIGSFYAFILSRTPRVRLTVVARSNYEAVKKDVRLTDSMFPFSAH